MREPIPAYTPIWLFRFFEFLNNLPVPFWILAILYVVVMAVVRHLVGWQQGLIPQGEWNVLLAVNPLFSLAVIVFWQYLDRRAHKALTAFYIHSGKSRQATRLAIGDFLSLPAWPATILFVFGLGSGYVSFLDTASQIDSSVAQVLPLVSIIGFSLALGFYGLIVFRLLRQIGMMRRMLEKIQADLFNPYPVYALSSYGASFALGAMITYFGPSLPVVDTQFTATGLIGLSVFSLGVIVIFFAPLLGIGTRMRAAKENLLARNGSNLRDLSERLNQSVERAKFAEADKLRGSLSGLREQRELIQKTPTWPWQPDTLRNVFTPLLIPVIVYLVQRFLGSALGF